MPGGAFRIDPVPGLDTANWSTRGPTSCSGYAESPADLAAGRTISELRTGDLARKHPAGVYEVVGRRSRFVKIVGLRVDLGQVERILADLGVQAASAGTDQGVVVAVEGDHDTHLLGKVLAQGIGLPRAALELHAVEHLPRLATGKLDYPAVLALSGNNVSRQPPARPEPAAEPRAGGGSTAAGPDSVRRIFQDTLEVTEIADGDTFVSLGGDSLSYVAASVRLEQALGHLPQDWHVTPVRDLEPRRRDVPARRMRRFFAPLETSIVLRAVAIVLIVSTHVGFFSWQGTAHVLMAVAGYNFARFQLSGNGFPGSGGSLPAWPGWWSPAWRSSRSPT